MLRIALIIVFLVAPAALINAQGDQPSHGELQGAIFSPAGDSQPQGLFKKTYEYYDNGKIMLCNKLTPAGQVIEKTYYNTDGKVEKTERYDTTGDKIEEANYDENGNLVEGIGGWAAKRWVYKDGMLRAESVYGPDGHLTERKIYNESGDLVDRQYVGDGTIDPSEEFNRGSVVTHETDQFYDRYGNQTGSVTTEVDDPDDIFGDI